MPPGYDYGFFSYESKDDFLNRSREFWNPDKTDFWQDAGIEGPRHIGYQRALDVELGPGL